MSADKRTVATDALETLGMIITANEKRDAIHLAVENCVAAHPLRPGEHVGLVGNGEAGICDKPVGIVDPFLEKPVLTGQRFWLVVYPRQIKSLRHVWEHPAFPASGETDAPAATASDPRSESERWIANFADSIDQTVNRVMSAAEEWLESDGYDYTRDDSESYKGHWDEFTEFWRHYETVTGKTVPDKLKECFFTCSC